MPKLSIRVLRKLFSPSRNRPTDAVPGGHRAGGKLPGAAERDADLLLARASTLFAAGRYIEARHVLLDAEQAGLRSADAYIKLGWACFWTGKLDEALESMRKAAAMRPDDWAAHFGVASVLRTQGHAAAACASFERALELKLDSLHCLSNLVACEIDQGHLDSAERYARSAMEMDPRSAAALSDLGMVLCEQRRFDDAIAAFEHANALQATSDDAPDDTVNFAICLLRAGRTQRALDLLEASLPTHPSATGHSQYALALLISGRLVEGFDQYEFRWSEAPLSAARPNFVKPAWTGQDLRGRTILVRAEQGFGDFIQFARYLRHVKALGATVLLFVREELRELAEAIDGVDRVLRPNQPYPPFDFYVNLLSLPRVFATDLGSIPAKVPYLPLDSGRVSAWSQRFAGENRLKVGLVWAGSPTHLRDRFRSLALQQLLPFASVGGVQMYSLQKASAASELSKEPFGSGLVDLGRELNSFADTVAAISQLDLVIGVDTAVVHVAGALGKPVWTLVPNPADWRWLESRNDSPWYPTMRLFRQRAHGDWAEVIARVTHALETRVHAGDCDGDRDALLGQAQVQEHAPAQAAGAPAASLKPTAAPVARANPDFSCVAETRVGIVQYFPDSSPASKSIEWYGEYLQLQLDLLAPLVEPGMTAMEVGAGVGVHAIWLSRAVGTGSHLFLHEDDPRLRQVLKQNLAANGVANATLLNPGPETDSIDALAVERLDWLKVGDPAKAIAALQGANDSIWRLRPRFFLAAADQQALDDLALHVKAFGYRCWACRVPLFNPANFNRRENDLFPGETSWALLAIPEELGIAIAEHPFLTALS